MTNIKIINKMFYILSSALFKIICLVDIYSTSQFKEATFEELKSHMQQVAALLTTQT